MKLKAQIMDGNAIERSVIRIAHEIIEKNQGTENLALIGIKTRGVPLARMIKEAIEKIAGKQIEMGILDITLYRDDLSANKKNPVLNSTEIPFSVIGKTVVLVDDVIFTGRTARAAIDAVFAEGRAGRIQLAVLIDRGHRELPIRADFVGKNIPTSKTEVVMVHLNECDGDTSVHLYEKTPQ